MFLSALYEYANEHLDLPPEGYAVQGVRYVIEVGGLSGGRNDSSGTPLAVVDTAALSEDGRPAKLLVPRLDVQRSSGIKPCLLADNGEYVLGVPREQSGSRGKVPRSIAEDVLRRHRSFLVLLRDCYEDGGMRDEAVEAVLGFYERLGAPFVAEGPGRPDPRLVRLLPEGYEAGLRVTFTFEGEPVSERPSVRRFWASRISSDVGEGPAATGQCMITGRVGPLVGRMPGSVRGLPGGLATGSKLISFNQPAFESYGYEAARNAPLSPEAARKIDAGLTDLLSRPGGRFLAGETLYLFWGSGRHAGASVGALLGSLLYTPQAPRTLQLLAEFLGDEALAESDLPPEGHERALAVYGMCRRVAREAVRGARQPDADGEAEGWLNALALQAHSARVAVRSFHRGLSLRMLDSAARFILSQGVVARAGTGVVEPRGVRELARLAVSPGRDPSRSPRLFDELIRCAIGGPGGETLPLADEVLAGAARRLRSGDASSGFDALRLVGVGLVSKGVIGVEQLGEMEVPDLADERDAEAYDLGRLLAQLETIQRYGLGYSPGSTVSDKHYGLAVSAPNVGLSLPLQRANRAHLPRLKRRRAPLYYRLSGELDEILARLRPPYPASLNLQRQLLFGLGYRYQEARNRAAARRGAIRAEQEEARERRGTSDARRG